MTGLSFVARRKSCIIEVVIGEAIVHGEFDVIITIVREHIDRVTCQKTYRCSINGRDHLNWGGKE